MSETQEVIRISSRRIVIGGGTQPLSIQPGCISMQGAWITGVDLWENYAEELARAEGVTDFGDRLISPAFINPHSHLSLGVMRGMDVESSATGNMVEEVFFRFESHCRREDVLAFARIGAYESLLNGVGLVWDHYYHADAIVQALKEVGLAGVVAPTLQDVDGPGKDAWVDGLSATQALNSDLDAANRGIFAAMGPHATDTVSESLWKRVRTWSERWNVPIHAHLAQSLEEVQRCQERQGCTPVEWLNQLGVLDVAQGAAFAHGLYLTERDLGLLNAERHTLVACPYSQLVFGFPSAVSRWEAAGMRWVVATDCAANNDSMNVQKELRFLAGQRTAGTPWSEEYARFFAGEGSGFDVWRKRNETHAALHPTSTPDGLLYRVWSGPGTMHPKFHAGLIAVNGLANLLVWDLEHPAFWPPVNPLRNLAMADPMGAIHAMYVAGRQVGAAGNFHRSLVASDGYREARIEADERLSGVLKRYNGG